MMNIPENKVLHATASGWHQGLITLQVAGAYLPPPGRNEDLHANEQACKFLPVAAFDAVSN